VAGPRRLFWSAETCYHLGMATSSEIVSALHQAGYRLTRSRRAIAELVAEQSGHFSAADLIAAAQARPDRVGRATVFRAMEMLGELGLVERLDLPNGDHAYVSCALSHHHHVVCSKCGRSVEVADLGMEGIIAEVARRTGFVIAEHRAEFYGLCPACQETGPAH
jgi:Fur family ferric uptake transcriptional regulator